MGFIDHSQLLSTAKRKALHPQASMSSPDERRPSTFLRLTPDAPVTTDRRPSTFLNLAPDTSNSYPRLPAHRDSVLRTGASIWMRTRMTSTRASERVASCQARL